MGRQASCSFHSRYNRANAAPSQSDPATASTGATTTIEETYVAASDSNGDTVAHAPPITRVRREYRSARRRLQTKATARSANPWTNTTSPPGASCPHANWLGTHGMHMLHDMYMPKPNSGKKARALPIARHPSPSESRTVLTCRSGTAFPWYLPLAAQHAIPLENSTPHTAQGLAF